MSSESIDSMISSEELQQMCQKLSAEPFKKVKVPYVWMVTVYQFMNFQTVSMVSLDTMSGEDYISLVNEIIHFVDQKQPSLIQCRSEAPEQRVMRHLEFLKGVQYNPVDPTGIKAGILMGEKKHMLPILRFLILDLDGIKERAYLAR